MIVRTSAQGRVVQAQVQWWGWSPPSRLGRTSTLALPSRCQGHSRISRTLARAKKVRILYHLQHFLCFRTHSISAECVENSLTEAVGRIVSLLPTFCNNRIKIPNLFKESQSVTKMLIPPHWRWPPWRRCSPLLFFSLSCLNSSPPGSPCPTFVSIFNLSMVHIDLMTIDKQVDHKIDKHIDHDTWQLTSTLCNAQIPPPPITASYLPSPVNLVAGDKKQRQVKIVQGLK